MLGPVLRRGRDGGASVWVETSISARVAAGGSETETFCVAGHHYAVVDCVPSPDGGYTVTLDGVPAWPDPTGAPRDGEAVFRPWRPGRPFRIMAGSCRQQGPQRSRWWRGRGNRPADDLGVDALAAAAADIQAGRRTLPHLLVLMGDQVYADEQHESVEQTLDRRRGGPPNAGWPQVSSFEEYTWLYQATWSHPQIRWMLASVPTVMIFDDHDVIDDWNISDTWAAEMTRDHPWWPARIRAALMAYWVYQHLGNMSSTERERDELYRAVVAAEDGHDVLAGAIESMLSPAPGEASRSWSFVGTLGPVTVAVLDARHGRVLTPEARSMLSPADWRMLDDAMAGTDDHLLVVSSVPWILPKAIHDLERLVSRLVLEGGSLVSRAAELVRRAIDLEHWAAFGSSFDELLGRLEATAAREDAPASQVVLSGDVHFACVAEQPVPRGRPVHQVIASPMRQAQRTHELLARRLMMRRPAAWAVAAVLRLWTGRPASTSFEITSRSWFVNNLAEFVYTEHEVTVRLLAARDDRHGGLSLTELHRQQL